MYNLNDIKQYEEKKNAQAQQPASPSPGMDAPLFDRRDNLTPLTKPFQQMAADAANKPIPKIDHFDMDEVQKNARSQYIQSFDKWSDAEKDGTFSQQEWANKRIEKMVAEGQNPGEYLNVLSLIGDTETPAERAKREKREALGETFRNLGNLIGNAANLYYTNKGGQYIDLNSVNEKHRERMEKIKEKQDALDEKRKNIILNAKLEDLKNEHADRLYDKKLKASQAENDLAYKRELFKLELQNAYKRGQIDAKTKTDKELEAIRQQNRLKLKATPSYGEDKVLTSVTGADGNVWTRNSKLDDVEIRELAKYVEDWSPYTTVGENGKETIDYIGAIADAAESGHIPVEVLEQRGYKKGETTKKGGTGSGKKPVKGFSDGEKNKKTISGF